MHESGRTRLCIHPSAPGSRSCAGTDGVADPPYKPARDPGWIRHDYPRFAPPSSMRLLPAALAAVLLLVAPALACSTFVITPGASDDGSMYIAHTNDGFGPSVIGHNVSEEDTHLVYVPAADHPPGAKRTVRFDPNSGSDDPVDRASTDHRNTSEIDEVPHTYGYLTGSYGIINEVGLMSSECTDYVRVQPNWDPGRRILYSSELSNIALERCRTSREAVELVGGLIDRYGYYGTGETLLFADPKEAWVIEMCGYDMNGTGGLWAAERIPDGHVFVAANTFRIREITPGREDQLHSKNLFSVAEERGWWRPSDGPLDWLRTVSTGEYSHPYYSLSRVWRLYDRVAPSLNLSPYVEGTYTTAYPFSTKPDVPLNVTTALSLFRDHYEGTVFDLTSGPAAGPFGDPYRDSGPFDNHQPFPPGEVRPGAWPRPISPLFCSYSYVCQGRSWLPADVGGTAWIGFAVPAETVYLPVYAGSTALPASFATGNRSAVSRDSAWWAFNLVTNWARLRYRDMIPEIRAEQQSIEAASLENRTVVDREALRLRNTSGEAAARAYLTNWTVSHADAVLDRWWAFSDRLIARYANGMVNDAVNRTAANPGYPAAWLDANGYQYGPRIYDLEGLKAIPDLVFVNETVFARPGDELSLINQTQRRAGNATPVPVGEG